jgi:putative pyruvate formate lyase activating enzyme
MSKLQPETLLRPDEAGEPAYLALHRSGELQKRAEAALTLLESCRVCPRECRVDRQHNEQGFCKTGRYALVSSAFAHMGEEDCLRGWQGSGTIFFSRCNLGCDFCQNFDISQAGIGEELNAHRIADVMLRLQTTGCHNINLVTPAHVVPQVLEALILAVNHGLCLPLVYNTSGYDPLDTLQLLDGVVDIYMPDFKFWYPDLAARYMDTPDYPEVAQRALREMHRQVGTLKMDGDGLARRGVLVRHLVMPGLAENTRAIMRFLAEEISPDTYVNVMAQYHPSGKVGTRHHAEINRALSPREYAEAIQIAHEMGLWRLDDRRPLWALQMLQ